MRVMSTNVSEYGTKRMCQDVSLASLQRTLTPHRRRGMLLGVLAPTTQPFSGGRNHEPSHPPRDRGAGEEGVG